MAKTRVGSHPSYGETVVVNSTSSFSLDPSDSGKTFILKGAAVTVTLPTLSTNIAGFQINLISGDDSEHVVTGGASKMYGFSVQATATVIVSAKTTLTLGTAVVGDRFTATTDGTNWYVYAFTNTVVTQA